MITFICQFSKLRCFQFLFLFILLQDSGAGSSLDEDEPIKTNRRYEYIIRNSYAVDSTYATYIFIFFT